MENIYAVNFGQPEYNNMSTMFEHTVDKGLKLIGLPMHAGEQAVKEGRELHNNVHCW
jgi:hypothetical protein